MAIRRTAYDQVGGFPPDTIGVETNRGERSFSKLYIGPGDYGLCLKVRNAGFRVYYSSDIAVFHVIPPVRFTVGFWRSRVIGEGYYLAIAQRGFFHLGPLRAYLARLRWQLILLRSEQQLLRRLAGWPGGATRAGMLPEELYVFYARAYLDMDYVLRRYPDLWRFLWKIGAEGVSSADYDYVMDRLPQEYKDLVATDFVYDATPVDSLDAYRRVVAERGYYRKSLNLFLRHDASRRIAMSLVEKLRTLKAKLKPRAEL
jgi:hypothetical protein